MRSNSDEVEKNNDCYAIYTSPPPAAEPLLKEKPLKGSAKMKKAIILLLHIPLAVFLIVEYFMFMWFWGGDDAFAFLGCGISFIIYLALHFFAYYKVQIKFKRIIIYNAIILTPILSVITIYLIVAPLLGISIQVA